MGKVISFVSKDKVPEEVQVSYNSISVTYEGVTENSENFVVFGETQDAEIAYINAPINIVTDGTLNILQSVVDWSITENLNLTESDRQMLSILREGMLESCKQLGVVLEDVIS